ncbi:ABC transporter ATP-binding protein [Heliorestis convoluta]|uniref:ABC transporter family protein n=1 Tax=Heliorestis convoluta TaxID=356322 RepID=A0A5Q2N0A4_9FIRM|nr:ABC transporter ATP-binding protein [Heliorestis convoluta]QGG48367.1 ABC transporter family protein [Heliorestis convoluta]
MLEARQITQIYGKQERIVLDHLDLRIGSGEFVAITGPSGCGKTTLLCILGSLLRPTSGEVWIDGQCLTEISAQELAYLRAEKIGFVFQFPAFLPTLNIMENLLLPTALALKKAHQSRNNEEKSLEQQRLDQEEVHYRALVLLEQVGLAGREKDLPSTLSGGEQRRVAVARALINRPRLLLADEPTGALDQETGEHLIDLLAQWNEKEGLTLVMATHDHSVARRARRQICL